MFALSVGSRSVDPSFWVKSGLNKKGRQVVNMMRISMRLHEGIGVPQAAQPKKG